MDAARQTNGLVFVHRDDIHAYWPYVQPRLAKVKAKTKARWIPEDVYTALKAGSASLHIGEVGDAYVGLVVLQQTTDYDGKTLWVWVVYSDGNVNVIDRYEKELVGFARKIGAKRLAFSSPRNWGRRLKSYGWAESHAVYEKEV